MGFRENLHKKIEIKRLADKVVRSVNPTDSTKRIDLDAMRQLLALGTYVLKKERDLDLYRLDDRHLLLLDNELKIYNTTAEDVALRKSPTVKEMVSIRNAIKILNDKDVVIRRKEETVRYIQAELIDGLDLSFTFADIESMADDGIQAIKNKYAEGVIEIMTLFAELLGFIKAPKAFQAAHHHIWGRFTKSGQGGLFGPAVIFSPLNNSLKLLPYKIKSDSRADMNRFKQVIKDEIETDLTDIEVLERLKQMVADEGPAAATSA